MEWSKRENGGSKAPKEAVTQALKAQKDFGVPAGVLLATCQLESGFRLGLVSSAGAVGPMQFKRCYERDYYRYAGFRFDLEGWEAVYGAGAVFAHYARRAEKLGFAGEDVWRYCLCAHRYGQNAPETLAPAEQKRVLDAEKLLRLNGPWYAVTDGAAVEPSPPPEESALPAKAIRCYNGRLEGDSFLSPHFRLREFACKDGSVAILLDDGLVALLEILRERLGGKPMHIVSGYRSKSYNTKIGGAKKSRHTTGEAADVRVDGATPEQVALTAEALLGKHGGLGLYAYGADDKPGFVHIDTREGKKARWVRTRSHGQSDLSVKSIADWLAQQGK